MAITTTAYVKIMADLYTRAETSGDPTSASSGTVGDIWLNNKTTDANYGATWELTSITVVISPPSTTYNWTRLTRDDPKIAIGIARAEQDFLRIRGIPFELDDDGVTVVYPDGAENIAAEMVCYICGIGMYFGRGSKSESLSDRSVTYETKICGYPVSIVGGIEQFQRVS